MGHKKNPWNIFRPSPWYQAVRGGISVALALWMAAWFWWLWNAIHPWPFLVFIFCSMPRKSISNLQRTSHITSEKHPQHTWYLYLYLSYILTSWVSTETSKQIGSLFIHSAFMAPKSSRTMAFFGRNVGWMNGNQHNWLGGFFASSGKILRSDWGTNACIGFYRRNYGMFACLPSFPCQMLKCVILFFHVS